MIEQRETSGMLGRRWESLRALKEGLTLFLTDENKRGLLMKGSGRGEGAKLRWNARI